MTNVLYPDQLESLQPNSHGPTVVVLRIPLYLPFSINNSEILHPQVQFAQRKKFTEVVQQPLYMAKCTVLANHYFGFNGWSTRIVQVLVKEDFSL